MTSNDDLPPTTAEATTTLTKPEEAVPYIWAECHPPAEETLQLWVEVGNKLEKEATGEYCLRGSSLFVFHRAFLTSIP